ncbi:hypothetical protein [Actinoplanes sp. NPDC049265]|uniref:hypothetical protein n=1 Tax=Actinoplanes sp. NPDC049265 TaxID=3363902 RepID=UPI003710AD32
MLHLNTHQLQIGDTVHLFGMRIHLTREPIITQRERTVYVWIGDVLNPHEVIAADLVPKGFLGEDVWVEGRGWVWKQTNRWEVQGNDLALWAVERPIEAETN